MKFKFKVVLLISAFLLSVCMGTVSVSRELPPNLPIEGTKSELAIATPTHHASTSQLINSNGLGLSQRLLRRTTTEPALTVGQVKNSSTRQNQEIVQNVTESLLSDRGRRLALAWGSSASSSFSRRGTDDFPLGWYDSVDNLNTPTKIAKEGINIVIPYSGKSSTQEIKAYLDKAAAAGLKVIVDLPRQAVRAGRTSEVLQMVREFKNHPATFGWYLFDEPDFINLSPNILKRLYQNIKREDGKHPIVLSFTKLERVSNYLDSVDILMFSKYPSNYNEPEFSNLENGVFSRIAQGAASLAHNNNNSFWFILQAYGEDRYGRQTQYNKRFPTATEQRYMFYSAILAQADGLFFWTHYRSQQKWIDSVLSPLVQEFKSYIPTIKTQPLNEQLTINNSQIQANLYRNPTNNSLLLIAINNGNSQVNTAIVISSQLNVSSATVLTKSEDAPPIKGEVSLTEKSTAKNSINNSVNNSVQLNRGRLTDTFKPYAVHIYQIKPA